ncbi:hypothetical protein [Allokutzneria oryzae]|uniref:Uncharacterized protein n=1 Tax=Allokutzneria oryzae TaxID=1378989 RepID=A0ABV5ZUY1_9PSEU
MGTVGIRGQRLARPGDTSGGGRWPERAFHARGEFGVEAVRESGVGVSVGGEVDAVGLLGPGLAPPLDDIEGEPRWVPVSLRPSGSLVAVKESSACSGPSGTSATRDPNKVGLSAIAARSIAGAV